MRLTQLCWWVMKKPDTPTENMGLGEPCTLIETPEDRKAQYIICSWLGRQVIVYNWWRKWGGHWRGPIPGISHAGCICRGIWSCGWYFCTQSTSVLWPGKCLAIPPAWPRKGSAIPIGLHHWGLLTCCAYARNAHTCRGPLTSHSSYWGGGFVLRHTRILDSQKGKQNRCSP